MKWNRVTLLVFGEIFFTSDFTSLVIITVLKILAIVQITNELKRTDSEYTFDSRKGTFGKFVFFKSIFT
jgi:hypothetical protein